MKYYESAKSWDAWREYVDPGNTMDLEEFEELTIDERIQIMVSIWGAEATAKDADQLDLCLGRSDS